jgi:hypothetical protein
MTQSYHGQTSTTREPRRSDASDESNFTRKGSEKQSKAEKKEKSCVTFSLFVFWLLTTHKFKSQIHVLFFPFSYPIDTNFIVYFLSTNLQDDNLG